MIKQKLGAKGGYKTPTNNAQNGGRVNTTTPSAKVPSGNKQTSGVTIHGRGSKAMVGSDGGLKGMPKVHG